MVNEIDMSFTRIAERAGVPARTFRTWGSLAALSLACALWCQCLIADATCRAGRPFLAINEDSLGNVPELQFDVSACTKGLVRCVIARGDTLQVADSVLARARANLPENCRLLVVGNELVLKVGKVGFCMHLQ